MSSKYTRDTFKQFLTDNIPSEKQIDLTGQYQELRDMVKEWGLNEGDSWLGVQFVGHDELPVTVPATNDQGKYRETGAIYLHVVGEAVLGGAEDLLTRGETLRSLLRGQRIGEIVIESVTPMNFDEGATLQFDGGYMSGSFLLDYYRELDL